MSIKEKLELQIISFKELIELNGLAGWKQGGIQEEINTIMPFTSFTHSICSFNQPKENPKCTVKKIQTVDTGLTNIS